MEYFVYMVVASRLIKKGRWCEMTAFEAISLMISFSLFTVTLLAEKMGLDGFVSSSNNVDNEIEVLKSKSLAREVVNNLGRCV